MREDFATILREAMTSSAHLTTGVSAPLPVVPDKKGRFFRSKNKEDKREEKRRRKDGKEPAKAAPVQREASIERLPRRPSPTASPEPAVRLLARSTPSANATLRANALRRNRSLTLDSTALEKPVSFVKVAGAPGSGKTSLVGASVTPVPPALVHLSAVEAKSPSRAHLFEVQSRECPRCSASRSFPHSHPVRVHTLHALCRVCLHQLLAQAPLRPPHSP